MKTKKSEIEKLEEEIDTMRSKMYFRLGAIEFLLTLLAMKQKADKK